MLCRNGLLSVASLATMLLNFCQLEERGHRCFSDKAGRAIADTFEKWRWSSVCYIIGMAAACWPTSVVVIDLLPNHCFRTSTDTAAAAAATAGSGGRLKEMQRWYHLMDSALCRCDRWSRSLFFVMYSVLHLTPSDCALLDTHDLWWPRLRLLKTEI